MLLPTYCIAKELLSYGILLSVLLCLLVPLEEESVAQEQAAKLSQMNLDAQLQGGLSPTLQLDSNFM